MDARGWAQAVVGERVLEVAAAEEADAEHALRLRPGVQCYKNTQRQGSGGRAWPCSTITRGINS
jgi:hypothetical protein